MDKNFNTINEDDMLLRAIEILNVMYPNSSEVTNAISFKRVEGRDYWLYGADNYFEDITDKIYLEPEYTSEYVWLNGLDRFPTRCFVIPYKYFSMSDNEIISDYRKRVEITNKKQYKERLKNDFIRCKNLDSIPIDYIKSWGAKNQFDEIINTLISDWNNYTFE